MADTVIQGVGPLSFTPITAGRVLMSDGTVWAPVAISGDATVASGGALTLATTAPTAGRWCGWRAAANFSTTLVNVGFVAATISGSGPSVFTDGTGSYVNYVASSTVNTSAGINVGSDTQTRLLPDATFTIKTGPGASDIAACRLWVGWGNGGATNAASAANHAAFRFSPTDGDTKWTTVTTDASNNVESNAVGSAVAVDTRYVLRIKVVSTTQIDFYLNGVLVASHITRAPASTTTLSMFVTIFNTTGGTARNFRFQQGFVTML